MTDLPGVFESFRSITPAQAIARNNDDLVPLNTTNKPAADGLLQKFNSRRTRVTADLAAIVSAIKG